MDPAFASCNKRSPGTGCAARDGFNREHALFGAGDSCVAVHPSDMAVALAVLGASVHVQGPAGSRVIPLDDFFALPGARPERDNTLEPAELIVGIELPPSDFADHSWYLKVRDRHSYAFALVSVAVGLHVVDGVIRSAAIAMGGVAAKPWRIPGGRSRARRTTTCACHVPGRRPTRHGGRRTAQRERIQGRPRQARRRTCAGTGDELADPIGGGLANRV